MSSLLKIFKLFFVIFSIQKQFTGIFPNTTITIIKMYREEEKSIPSTGTKENFANSLKQQNINNSYELYKKKLYYCLGLIGSGIIMLSLFHSNLINQKNKDKLNEKWFLIPWELINSGMFFIRGTYTTHDDFSNTIKDSKNEEDTYNFTSQNNINIRSIIHSISYLLLWFIFTEPSMRKILLPLQITAFIAYNIGAYFQLQYIANLIKKSET